MATIKKSLSTKQDGRDYSQILFRVSISKDKKLRLKTNIFIPTKRWDKEKERINSAKAIGVEKEYLTNKETELKGLEAKILKICEIYPLDILDKEFVEKVLVLCKEVDVSKLTVSIVDGLIEQEQHPEKFIKPSFFELFDKYLTETSNKYSEIRKRNIGVVIRDLKRYEMFVRLFDKKRKDFTLDIDTIDKDILGDFESYLRNEHSLVEEYPTIFKKIPTDINPKRKSPKPQPKGNNTIHALLSKLRAFCHWCNSQGYTQNRPFDNYSIREERYGTPYYITLDERNKIADFDLSNHPQLAVQRDICIFQCCIGCRVSDLMNMTNDNIINGFVEYVPKKTKNERPVTVRVPLNERASALVEKYKGADKQGHLFPFISSIKYNIDIKKIFKICGVTRMVTVLNTVTGEEEKRPINEIASSHLCRRTFIGNLYRQVKDPNLVGALSGHKEGSRAFVRYRQIDDEMKKDLVNLID